MRAQFILIAFLGLLSGLASSCMTLGARRAPMPTVDARSAPIRTACVAVKPFANHERRCGGRHGVHWPQFKGRADLAARATMRVRNGLLDRGMVGSEQRCAEVSAIVEHLHACYDESSLERSGVNSFRACVQLEVHISKADGTDNRLVVACSEYLRGGAADQNRARRDDAIETSTDEAASQLVRLFEP